MSAPTDVDLLVREAVRVYAAPYAQKGYQTQDLPLKLAAELERVSAELRKVVAPASALVAEIMGGEEAYSVYALNEVLEAMSGPVGESE